MSLPQVIRTWQTNRGEACGGTGVLLTDCRDTMWKLASRLINALSFTKPWTVWGSCDGSGGAGSFGNGDGVNRWSSGASCVWGGVGVNHSWIVLVQSGISAKTMLCIDLSSSSTANASFIVSPSSGFGLANGGTNGTATARPTATDELTINVSTGWGAAAAAFSAKLTVQISADGQATRVIIGRGGLVAGCIFVETAKPVRSDWLTLPVWGYQNGGTGITDPGVLSLTNLVATGAKARLGAVAGSLGATCEAYGTASSVYLCQVMTYADEVTGEWCMPALGWFCYTAGARGKVGDAIDVRWGSVTRATDDDYPADGSCKWWQVGDVAIPGDGSALPLS